MSSKCYNESRRRFVSYADGVQWSRLYFKKRNNCDIISVITTSHYFLWKVEKFVISTNRSKEISLYVVFISKHCSKCIHTLILFHRFLYGFAGLLFLHIFSIYQHKKADRHSEVLLWVNANAMSLGGKIMYLIFFSKCYYESLWCGCMASSTINIQSQRKIQ